MSSILPEALEAAEVAATRGKWFPNAVQIVEKVAGKTIDFLSGFNTIDQAAKNFKELEDHAANGIKATLEPLEKKLVHDAATLAAPLAKKIEHAMEKVVDAAKSPVTPAVHPHAHHPAASAPHPAVPHGAAAAHELVGPGSTGTAVTELQKDLGVRADGIDGKQTTEALKNFQREHGLKPDGIAGEKTWAALEPAVHEGSRGDAVRRIQKELGVTVDGVDGPQTTAAVKKFQDAHGLKPDGIVGDETWKALDASAKHAEPAFPAKDKMVRFPLSAPGDFSFDNAMSYSAGGQLTVRYGGQDLAVDNGYQQSGRIVSIKDGIVTQSTGRGTAEYHLSDLLSGAQDPEAMRKSLVPGLNIEVSVTPNGVRIADLDHQLDLDKAHTHSR